MKLPALMTRAKPGASVSRAARELGPWFHNLHMPDLTQTAPDHPLGDFPACKWKPIAKQFPRDMRGWTVLDVGCNAGFYSIELARRGAEVTAIDKDPHFLRQARWAIRQHGLHQAIRLRQLHVYDLARWRERFDLVVFMGVFYHLRYPLLGLDLVAEKVGRLLLFQSLTMPGESRAAVAANYDLQERDVMLGEGWPKMGFIEHSLANDPTNWWAPNHACLEGMLRSTGMRHIRRIAHETYLCTPQPRQKNWRTWDEKELRIATGQIENSARELSKAMSQKSRK